MYLEYMKFGLCLVVTNIRINRKSPLKKEFSPMEGFWGLMKREMYYGKKYKTKEELMLAIEKYIDYYTNKRVQRNLGVLTPLEFHEQKLKNVA